MAQQPRTIHPEDAQNERLAQVPLTAAYTFAYLPTVLDDAGRVKDQPPVLNGYLWPLRADEHSTETMRADLDALAEADLVCRYTVGDQAVLHDPAWRRRQQIARPAASVLPPCPTHDTGIDDLMGDTLRKLTDQINSFVGSATASFDESKVRDVVGRAVEDIGFMIDPEKASSYAQMVRDMFGRSEPASETGRAERLDEPEAGEPDLTVWDDVTDDVGSPFAGDDTDGDDSGTSDRP